MNNFEDHKTPLEHLSPALMEAYLAGKLSNRMQHEVEKYLLDHPFEAEAMEGYSQNPAAFEAITGLTENLQYKINQLEKGEKETKVIPFWRKTLPFAATFTILLIATVLAVYFYGGRGQENPITLSEPDTVELNKIRPEPLKTPPSTIAAKQKEATGSSLPKELQNQRVQKKSSKTAQNIQKQQQETAKITKQFNSGQAIVQNEIDTDEVSEPVNDFLDKAVSKEVDVSEDAVAVKSEDIAAAAVPQQAAMAKKSTTNLDRATTSIQNGNQQLQGIITDEATGEPLPGVSVLLKNSNRGVNSNLDGEFSITASPGDILVISFIGMSSKEVKVTDMEDLEVGLSPDVRQLSEVVITSSSTEAEESAYRSAQPMGGKRAFKEYIEQNLNYPEDALKNGIEGLVKLKLHINAAGDIFKIEVIKSLSESCDAEAIRLIKEGPNWEAAEKNNEKINSTVRIRIKFNLPE